MALPWAARVAHDKAAVREGLKIVRKVIARDAVKSGLTTTEIYKLALKENAAPTFARTLPTEEDDSPKETQYGKAGRRRIPPPEPPHPRHPVRSISFLKHKLLPIIEGERHVRHLRETRMVFHSVPSMKPREARGGKQQQAAAPKAAVPVEATVWLWRAMRPPKQAAKPPAPRPPIVYDYSHMKASKRKAHRAREELAAKRAVLHERREKLRSEARWKVDSVQRAERRAEARARHEAAEKAGLVEKERRRAAWEARNPQMARALAKNRAEVDKTAAPVKPSTSAKRVAPVKKRRAA
ncbi:hypothetical protein DFH07DRAFT_847816 [Mycena maculata]|uniref:Uncharacterized protein n=1 Tax=Mycena maculata TaxID=230809 RepID=A0AAD7HZF0_9AGAR|nr:hypothetical protein DFH07DRAFT_847816 [Mycena maculata]